MRTFKPRLAVVALSCVGVFGAEPAGAIPFNITAASFSVGTGYGADASETSSPTLLNVLFSTAAFSAQSFSLNSVGASQNFAFGTVNFAEPSAGGGIDASETDNLGVTANLTFTNPVGAVENVAAVGTATTGSVSDAGTDYTLIWTPFDVAFGAGGLFRISLNDLSFSNTGTQSLTATVTLLNLPRIAAVPTPATIAVLGLGIASLGFIRRKRAA